MGLRNYSTTVPADRSVAEIQKMLSERGATGILLEYEEDGSGRIREVLFKMLVVGNTVGFRLPLKWRECAEAIAKDQTVPTGYRKRAREDEDYGYRVAWRILRDWIAAQMAIYDLEMVKLEEIFLPYAVNKSGKTLFEAIVDDPSRLIGPAR